MVDSERRIRHGIQFPVRVWERSDGGGWHSRPAKTADHRRRERLAANWPKDPDHG